MVMEKEPFQLGLSKNQTLTNLLREYQDDPRSRVFAKLADEYRKQGLIAQALEIIDEGLEFHPGFSAGLLVQAQCYFDKRRYADCLKILGKMLRDNSQNYRAERLRSDVYLRLGQRRAAIESLERVLEMVPQDSEVRKHLEELENLEFSTALPVVTNAPASTDRAPAPESDWFLGSKGEVEEFEVSDLGDLWSETVEHSEAVVDSQLVSENTEENAASGASTDSLASLADPEFATCTIAELYLHQGLKEKAKQVLEIILKREPNNEWARERFEAEFGNPHPSMTVSKRHDLMVRAQILERLLKNVNSYRKDTKYSV